MQLFSGIGDLGAIGRKFRDNHVDAGHGWNDSDHAWHLGLLFRVGLAFAKEIPLPLDDMDRRSTSLDDGDRLCGIEPIRAVERNSGRCLLSDHCCNLRRDHSFEHREFACRGAITESPLRRIEL